MENVLQILNSPPLPEENINAAAFDKHEFGFYIALICPRILFFALTAPLPILSRMSPKDIHFHLKLRQASTTLCSLFFHLNGWIGNRKSIFCIDKLNVIVSYFY